MTPRLTTFDAVLNVLPGTRVVLEGRYVRCHPDPMRPPDPSATSARVIFQDTRGVLVGRFGTEECERPMRELVEFSDRTVRVVGTLSRGEPWRYAGPPPSVWTGGGHQLVDVESIEVC